MKLHREQFLAAAMILNAASLNACRMQPDQSSQEGINPESAQNIGANDQNLGPNLGNPGQPAQNLPLGARGVSPIPRQGVVAPTNEGIVAAPVRETPVALAPVRETPVVAAPVRETIVIAPAREAPARPTRPQVVLQKK